MTRVYRLTVTWPTPDGKPFKDQSWAVWDAAVAYQAGGNGDTGWPAWLPESVDLLSRAPDDDGDCDRSHCASVISMEESQYHQLIVWVPHIRRRLYFSRPAALTVGVLLTEWGCTVQITESHPVTWDISTTVDGTP